MEAVVVARTARGQANQDMMVERHGLVPVVVVVEARLMARMPKRLVAPAAVEAASEHTAAAAAGRPVLPEVALAVTGLLVILNYSTVVMAVVGVVASMAPLAELAALAALLVVVGVVVVVEQPLVALVGLVA